MIQSKNDTGPVPLDSEANTSLLLHLSDIIDALGIDSTHPEWESKYKKLDFNCNGTIDVEDISVVAKSIPLDKETFLSI